MMTQKETLFTSCKLKKDISDISVTSYLGVAVKPQTFMTGVLLLLIASFVLL